MTRGCSATIPYLHVLPHFTGVSALDKSVEPPRAGAEEIEPSARFELWLGAIVYLSLLATVILIC